MSRFSKLGLCLVIAGGFAACTGCYEETPPATPPATTTEPADQPADEGSADRQPGEPAPMPAEDNAAAEPGVEGASAAAAPGEGEQTEAARIEASLASLSLEDRALAETQKICPVGGGPLGAMGTPIKVAVAGQEVFICCEHCQEPLMSDPDKYLAKIGLEPVEEEAVQ